MSTFSALGSADLAKERSDLLELSRSIHAKPELGFEEHHAHGVLTEYLSQAGFNVERGALGLATAFRATAGSGGPHIAILCEYDALPEIGHGCGHNIIAAAGVGAGIAAAKALSGSGTVHVIGSPAEEYGGGKILLGRRGAFDDIDVAMMVHPGDLDLIRIESMARHAVTARYRGRSAHAASSPHLGVNALDAAVLGYVGVSALRQQTMPSDRIHGVFREGGLAPNLIPERTSTEWNIRSLNADRLQDLSGRVASALRAGAESAGCSVDLEWSEVPYAEIREHEQLHQLFIGVAKGLGRDLVDPSENARVSGSTDMGNVSQHVPAIQPILQAAEPGTSLHSADFTAQAVGPLAERAVIDGALMMATAIGNLMSDPARTIAFRSEAPYNRTPWPASERYRSGH